MQKRIQFKQILRQRNASYITAWNKLLLDINSSSPILHLHYFGSISLIDQFLYIRIEQDNLIGFTPIIPMISLEDYFMKPQCFRLNMRPLSKMEQHVIQFLIDYLRKLIPSHNNTIYLQIIDFDRLGKLIVSGKAIQFINGQHHWKYNLELNRIQLPRLMQINQLESEEESKLQMGRKLSLSIKKNKESNSRMKLNKNKSNRANSAKKLNTSTNVEAFRTVTQEHTKISKEFYQSLSSLKPTEPRRKLQLNSRQPHQLKTEMNESKQKKMKSSKRVLTQKSQSISKISSSIERRDKKEIVMVSLKKAEKKLTLGNKQSFAPPQRRKMLKIDDFQTIQFKKCIQEFVYRCSLNWMENTNCLGMSSQKMKSFLQQIVSIFIDKQQQIKKRRQTKYNIIKYQCYQNPLKKSAHKRITNFNFIKLITPAEQDIFTKYYQLIEDYKQKFKLLTRQYIICYHQHGKLMKQFIVNLQQINKRTFLSQKLQIQIGLLLHEFAESIKRLEIDLIDVIVTRKMKVIVIQVQNQTSLEENIMSEGDKFQNIFDSLIHQIKTMLPSFMQMQPHQLFDIKINKTIMLQLLLGCRQMFKQNVVKFKTVAIRNTLNATYRTEKEGIALIDKLYVLRENLETQTEFKSQISSEGVFLKMQNIKISFIRQVDAKLTQIYDFFAKVYQKSENQLNLRLKTIIAINSDYLSDYKCKEYKQSIQDNYKSLIQSIMLLINYLYPLLKQSQIKHYLTIAYSFKQQIKQNFINFDLKLQEYRSISIKTIRILQAKNKESKEQLMELTQKLKKLMQTLQNQRTILQLKSQILQLDDQYQIYSIANKRLINSMRQNQMVYWEDDTFFLSHINMLKSSLRFLQGKYYKMLFNTPILELTIDQFYNAFQQFQTFMATLEENKLQKLFRSTFSMLQNNLTLAEIFLYREYTQFQLIRIKQIGIELELQKNSKLFATIKRFQTLQKKKYQKLLQLYRQSRLNEFNLHHDNSFKRIKLQKVKGDMNVQRISNLQQIKQQLIVHNQIKSNQLVDTLNELSSLYDDVVLFHKMISLISTYNFNQQNRQIILNQINSNYEKLLTIFVDSANIQNFKKKLMLHKVKFMEMLYIQKTSVFPRYCLMSVKELIDMSGWEGLDQISRNIKHMFDDIDHIYFQDQNTIRSLVVFKDILQFQKPFNPLLKQGQKSKVVYMQIESFMRDSLSHSQLACVQIKILVWFIYFTQQVELNLMTQTPLSKLKDHLQQLITQIANQIRYDIKLHHKTYEIVQLGTFITHLDKIGNIGSINDYEWVSTLRYYQKLKIIKVQQNERTYEYGFQPRKPQNYDPSFQLQTSISYGFKQSSTYYHMSSYILGQPYRNFAMLSEYGFQRNYLLLMNIVKKYGYYIHIQVDPINFESVNYFHKKIIELSFKKMKINQQETLRLPIFFQYSSQEALPPCFPQKYRKFSAPQFNYDINLVMLLQFNKFQHLLDTFGINPNTLCQALAHINSQKSLGIKKYLNFANGLHDYLQTNPERQQIYKFCFKYLILNYQVDDNELTAILKKLFVNKDYNQLQNQSEKLSEMLFQLSKGQSQKSLLLYGPTSSKTYSIKKRNIPYYKGKSQNNSIYHIQGLAQFQIAVHQNSELIHKFVIEERQIWNVQPNELTDISLYYVGQFSSENTEQIFKGKLSELKVDGNIKNLWKILANLHQIYEQIHQKLCLLSEVDLITRIFKKHITEFINQLQTDLKPYYVVSINKQIIRVFLIIVYQLYYYRLPNQLRKKFAQKIKELPFLQDYRSEELHSLTCRSLNCQKILNLMKKEKSLHLKIGSYLKELILIKKYISYDQTCVIQHSSAMMLQLIKVYLSQLQDDKIYLSLEPIYVQLIRTLKYKKIIYIVDDLHLASKQNLTFIKMWQEHFRNYNIKYILMTQHQNIKKYISSHPTFNYPQVEIEQVFKSQTKEGIIDQMQQKSRLLFAQNYFQNQMQFLSFLITITVKLPSQYYKKYYARHLIFTKLNISELAIDIITANQHYLKQAVDINSQKAYLIDTKNTHQQITESQVCKRIQKILNESNFVQKTIAKLYYKDILPYLLGDKIYIIKEDVRLLPQLISAVHERKCYCLKNTIFIEELLQIVDENYNSEAEVTVIVQQPLSTSQEWFYFMQHYLKGLDIISLYEEFKQFTEMLIKKQQFVFRLFNQQIKIKQKINKILYSKIKFIISLTTNSQLNFNCQYYLYNIVHVNCCLPKNITLNLSSLLFQRTIAQQSQITKEIVKQYQFLILQLIQTNLIDLNHLESFMQGLIQNIKRQIAEMERKKQALQQKRKLFQHLLAIKTQLQHDLEEEQKKHQQYHNIFSSMMQKINHHPIDNAKIDNEHFSDVVKLRQNFFNSQLVSIIRIDINQQFNIFCQQIETIFKDSFTNVKQYIFFTVFPEQLSALIADSSKRIWLQSVLNKNQSGEVSRFIVFRYMTYLLRMAEQYCKIEHTYDMIEKQVTELNYFYMLDVTIQLKKKDQIIDGQFQKLNNKSAIIQTFIGILISLQHLDLDQRQMTYYYCFIKAVKVIRAYAIDNQYKLRQMIQRQTQKYQQIQNQFDQHNLKQIQNNFQQFNLSILSQKKHIIFYDPYWTLQSLCSNMAINIIYVNTQNDLQQVYDYKFTITLYCIRLLSVNDYHNNKSFIDRCIDILDKKHTDLMQNRLEKLGVWVGERQVIAEIRHPFAIVNLDVTPISFLHRIQQLVLNARFKWTHLKKQYLQAKMRMRSQIQLIKTLSIQEIALYIIKIQQLILDFHQKYKTIRQISKITVIQSDIIPTVDQLYQNLLHLHKQNQFPLHLSMRLVSKSNIQQLLQKCKQSHHQPQKQKNQLIKHFLISNNTLNIVEQLQMCIGHSRYVMLIYNQFNKKLVKEILQLQQTGRYQMRTIIEVNQMQLMEFIKGSSICDVKEEGMVKQVILFFVKADQIHKMKSLLNKCSAIWMG